MNKGLRRKAQGLRREKIVDPNKRVKTQKRIGAGIGFLWAIRFVLMVGFFVGVTVCTRENPTQRILFDFESDAELDQLVWRCHRLMSISEEHVTHGKGCLRLEIYPSSSPILAPMIEREDWSGYANLSLDIFNPQEKKISIILRIDDRKEIPEYADRFNTRVDLLEGLNRVQVPLESLITSGTKRKMNTKRIYRFLTFMANTSEKAVLYVDYMRLERKAYPQRRRVGDIRKTVSNS